MEKKAEGQARKKALRMAVFILLALEAAALLARTVSEVGQYLRMDITNPAHHAIFTAVAAVVGGYVYVRERMKERQAAEEPEDQE